MPNFSSLAGLEVAEKFLWVGGGGWGGLHSHFHVKPNRCVVLCWGWGFDNSVSPEDTFVKIAVIGPLRGEGAFTILSNKRINGGNDSKRSLPSKSFNPNFGSCA